MAWLLLGFEAMIYWATSCFNNLLPFSTLFFIIMKGRESCECCLIGDWGPDGEIWPVLLPWWWELSGIGTGWATKCWPPAPLAPMLNELAAASRFELIKWWE